MEKLLFVKGYKDNAQLRKSFNELAESVFGIEFETWYQNGFWTEKYQPYSYVDNGKVVANVSVNLISLIINNEVKRAIQIGTVMTHPDYRSQGLSKRLMDKVLEDFKDVDLFYLFANSTVLDFYPKFGFMAKEEVQYVMEYDKTTSKQSKIKKLDMRNLDDMSFVYKLATNRSPISKRFGISGSEELLMFYCLMVFSQDLYFLEEEQALVIYQIENDTLHLYDLVSVKEVNTIDILCKITYEKIKKVVFHFQPEDPELILETQPYHSNNVLFIKNQTNVSMPEKFKHPITAQA
nr:GNAT family N-acetyltransferase [Neobacillus sp. Marseille-Q6967]